MAKFTYKYQIRTNNLNYGNLLLGQYNTLKEAKNNLCKFNNYGCIDIRKIRIYAA